MVHGFRGLIPSCERMVTPSTAEGGGRSAREAVANASHEPFAIQQEKGARRLITPKIITSKLIILGEWPLCKYWFTVFAG